MDPRSAWPRRAWARAGALAALLWLLGVAPLPSQAPYAAAPLPSLRAAGQDSASAYERRQGWFSRDKAYHALISAAGAGVLYALGRELGLGRWPSLLGAVAVTGTAGLLREVVSGDPADRLTRRHLSRRDLVWDGLGIAVGVSVTDLLLRDRWEAASGSQDPSAAP